MTDRSKLDTERARRYVSGGRRIDAGLQPETAHVLTLLTELEAAREVVAAAAGVVSIVSSVAPGGPTRGVTCPERDALNAALAAYREVAP